MEIFHFDDDAFFLEEFQEKLARQNFNFPIHSFTKWQDFYETLSRHRSHALVILDIQLGEATPQTGMEAISNIRRLAADFTIIMCSDRNDPLTVRSCFNLGADDFIFKGIDDRDLGSRLAQFAKSETSFERRDSDDHSGSIAQLCARIPKLIESAVSSVHISGEPGVGKDFVAEKFAALLPAKMPFIRVHCGAIAPSLLESELFGHKKGAFTGAIKDRIGLIEQAHGGWGILR